MLQIKLSQLDATLLMKGENVFLKAEQQALNKVVKQSRTLTSKEIVSETNLSAKDMKKSLSMKFADRLQTSMNVVLRVPNKKFPLIRFMSQKPNRKTRTLFASTFEKGRSVVNPEAFLATPTQGKNTGTRSAYVRVGKDRLPIRRVFSPSLSDMFNKLSLSQKLNVLVDSKLRPEYERLVNLYFGKTF